MSWINIKNSIQEDLLARNLKRPTNRLNALERVEQLLKSRNPQLIINPQTEFRLIDKNKLKADLSVYKKSGKISASESSIINEIYRRI